MFAYFLLFFVTHLYIVSLVFSIYYHRGKAHRMLEFSKPFEHFCRFILFTVEEGISPRWLKHISAEHRLHHRYTDGPEDFTSIYNRPLFSIISIKEYRKKKEKFTWEVVEKYAPDVPVTNDWIQLNVYQKYRYLGIIFMSVIYALLFGFWYGILGFIVTYSMRYVVPFFGDFLFHTVGYKNEPGKKYDRSRNFFPIGLYFSGEELHANHHKYPNRVNFATKWYEIDFGYYVILLLEKLGWVKVLKNSAIRKKTNTEKL